MQAGSLPESSRRSQRSGDLQYDSKDQAPRRGATKEFNHGLTCIAEQVGILSPQRLPQIAQRMVVQRHQPALGVEPMGGEKLGQLNQVIDGFVRPGHDEDARGAIAAGGDDLAFVRTEARAHNLIILLQRQGERLAGRGIPDAGMGVAAGH